MEMEDKHYLVNSTPRRLHVDLQAAIDDQKREMFQITEDEQKARNQKLVYLVRLSTSLDFESNGKSHHHTLPSYLQIYTPRPFRVMPSPVLRANVSDS